jgi:hypothetical protein
VNQTLSIDFQVARLQAYSATSAKVDPCQIKVNYFSQRDNYTQPHRTCNASSNAMYLDWLLRCTARKPLGGDDGYLRQVFKFGDSPDHTAQTQALKLYGFTTVWREDGNLDNVDALLDAGFPVVVNILHRGSISAPSGGHVIILIGRTGTTYIAHDPYGTLTSGYTDKNGAYSQIGRSEFRARWQGGYRTL